MVTNNVQVILFLLACGRLTTTNVEGRSTREAFCDIAHWYLKSCCSWSGTGLHMGPFDDHIGGTCHKTDCGFWGQQAGRCCWTHPATCHLHLGGRGGRGEYVCPDWSYEGGVKCSCCREWMPWFRHFWGIFINILANLTFFIKSVLDATQIPLLMVILYLLVFPGDYAY